MSNFYLVSKLPGILLLILSCILWNPISKSVTCQAFIPTNLPGPFFVTDFFENLLSPWSHVASSGTKTVETPKGCITGFGTWQVVGAKFCNLLAWNLFLKVILLMVEESGKLTSWGKGSLSHYLQGFLHPTGGWPWDFWTINSISGPFWRQNHSHLGSMVDAPQPPKKMMMCQVKAISQPSTGNKVYVKVSAYVGEFQYFYRPPRPRNKRNQLLFVGIWHWA